MNRLKAIKIKGFKKFQSLSIEFNEHMNILVGENEAGKSSILDAIRIVLNQQYRNSDKAVLKDLFNVEMVEAFQASPSIKSLPYIVIEVEFELDSKSKNSEYFYGEVYGDKKTQECKFGIRFDCKFDDDMGPELATSILQGKIPYEYYLLSWTTFGNKPYLIQKRPLQFISIDVTSATATTSFNYYNRTLFSNKYDEAIQAKARNEFRDKLEDAFNDIGLPQLDSNRRFGIDGKKIVLESILSVYEDSIPLENRGKGMESLIKTQIALDRNNGLDVILMEEPENHLCFSSMKKMIEEISKRQDNSQIIIVTHSNMIASRLNLKNVLWIANNKVTSLKGMNEEIAAFFVKADNNSFLQLLLSTKVFLVEGATEFLLLPYFFKNITGKTIEEAGVTIISCNGIAYKKYLAIAEQTDKTIAVITDNDTEQDKINEANHFNNSHEKQHIFMSDDVSKWTWEVCIYHKNQKILDSMLDLQPGAPYLFHGKDYGAPIGKMLNNKVEIAYQMLTSEIDFEAPQYVKEAIEWVNG